MQARKKIPWNKGMVGYGAGRVVSVETREKLRIASSGRFHSCKSREKMSEAHKKLVGELNPFYGKKHTKKSRDLNRQATTSRWKDRSYRSKVLLSRLGKQSGKNNPRWKGGVTPFNRMIRDCDEYLNWKNSVFSRDNFTCQECDKRGGYLEAHHIKEFYTILDEFLEEYNQFSPMEDKETLIRLATKYSPLWDIENGKTLCSKCHNKTKGVRHGA
jgi:hypothetical protein